MFATFALIFFYVIKYTLQRQKRGKKKVRKTLEKQMKSSERAIHIFHPSSSSTVPQSFIWMLQKEHTPWFQCMKGTKTSFQTQTEREEERQTVNRGEWTREQSRTKKLMPSVLLFHYSCCKHTHLHTHKHPLRTLPPPASLSAGHQQYFNVILSRDEQNVEYVTLGLHRIANDRESRQTEFVHDLIMEFTDGTHNIMSHLQDLCFYTVLSHLLIILSEMQD